MFCGLELRNNLWNLNQLCRLWRSFSFVIQRFGWRLNVCNLTPLAWVLRKRLRNGRLTLAGVGAWTVTVSTWTPLVGDFKCLQLWSELLCITTLRILMVFSTCALAKWWTLRFWSTMISWGKSLGWRSSSENRKGAPQQEMAVKVVE